MEELIAYVKAQNEKTKLWMAEDPQNRFGGMRSEDPQSYINRGINNLEDLKKRDLMDYIYDGYKDLHGIRPRWLKLSEMTMEELQMQANYLDKEFKIQESWQEEAIAEEEKVIEGLCKEFNCSKDDLKRWEVI